MGPCSRSFRGEDQICGWSAVGGQSQSAYARGGLQEDDTPGGHSNPGGSSSGPAIAVSAGFAPLAIGTETAGSLISPASKAALYTIKPTIGLVSQHGIVPISSLCDSAGPMTKSVLDLANMMDLIVDQSKTSVPAGGYSSVLTTTWADLNVGVLDPAEWGTTDSWTKPDPGATRQMREAFDHAYTEIERQAKSFHKFVPLPTADKLNINGEPANKILFTGHFKENIESYLGNLESSQVRTLEELIEFNRDHADLELPPRYPLQDRLEKALTHNYTGEDLKAALAHARKVGRDDGIDKILREYNIDVIIGPAESPMSSIAAASGYPIASMPLGYLDFNGRPFGMAALASANQEAVLIKVQISPTPIPTNELIKPPPLPLGGSKRSCYSFPKEFQWGFAGAALQIEGAIKEGGRGPSIWEGRSGNQWVRPRGAGPPDIAAMNYYLYKQDIARLAAVGVQSYSFSISWTRIVPFGVAGSPINKEGIDHYSDVIDTILSHGMKPVVTLHHFDTPVQFLSNSSFLSFDHPEFVDGFVYYAQTVLRHYADRVGTWYTFNEPTMDVNIMGNYAATHKVLMAHAEVVHWYRDVLKGTGLWSMKFDLSDTGFALPLNPANSSDVAAAVRRNEFTTGYYASPLFLGQPVPQVMRDTIPDRLHDWSDEDLAYVNGTADFFAFDIYTASYHSEPAGGFAACAADKNHPNYPACTVPSNSRPAGSWEGNFHGNVDRIAVPPEHVRTILGYFDKTYPTRGGVTIAEYGLPPFRASEMSLKHQVSDVSQSLFYLPILREILKAINEDGVHVKGVYGWSYLDNWEWGQYDDRYGVQSYNQTTMERSYKRVLFDYAAFMQAHLEE
ncbi:hypothetical protein ACHAQA_000692 [Verticillium albo-atrum]